MGTQLQNHNSEDLCDPEIEEADMGDTKTQAHVDAPDGGWGWVVLVATILVLALTLAFPSCMGIFYTDLQMEFSASNSETSWVPSIMIAVLHAGGTVVIQESSFWFGPLCLCCIERENLSIMSPPC